MPVTYERLNPEDYAARRLALRLKVQEGAPVESAARVLNIPRSTARLWAAQDGFRRKDLVADEAGAARPEMGDWAKPGRGKPRADDLAEDGLPAADYPQLRGLSPRQRLSALSRLAETAEMRAVAAIEEGCIGYGLAALSEARRLRRTWRLLQGWLERYPEPEPEDTYDDWDEFVEEIIAAEEGRDPVYREAPPLTQAQLAEKAIDEEIWAAILAVEEENLAALGKTRTDFPEEEVVARELQLAAEFWRLREARERWMSLPGRAPPEIVVRLPERRASLNPSPERERG